MKNEKTIHVFVKTTKTEQRELTFNHESVTGIELKQAAGAALDSDIFTDKGQLVADDQTITIKNGDHFAMVPRGAIAYTVNGEIQWTTEKELTPVKIMENAGIDPNTNYLIQIEGNNKKSFKDDPNATIHMHTGMVFITNFTGPKPVSNCK